MTPAPPRIAAYVRVSTDSQAERGYSIGEQTDRIKAYCQAREWNLVKIYTDPGYSGKSLDRPAIKLLIAECRQYDIILVNKLDRLSRSQKDTLHLIEDVFRANNVQFVSMSENFDTTTPLGMAMIGILSTFAQLEREQIKERMMTGQLGRAKKGLFHGSLQTPIGYSYRDGQLIVEEEEAAQVREIFHLFLTGKSLNAVAREIGAKPTTRRGTWDSHDIANTIQNPAYIGKLRYRGEVYDAPHEPIIDAETFEKAQRRYALIDHSNPSWQNPAKHLLTGITFCGVCGSRYMVGHSSSTARGRKYVYHYYQCYTRFSQCEKPSCGNKGYKQQELEEYIIRRVMEINYDDVKIEKKAPDHSKEITRLEKQKSRLIDLYAIESIDIAELRDRVAKIDEKLAKYAEPEEDPAKLTQKALKDILASSRDILSTGTEEQKRAVISSLIRRIVIHHDKIEIEWNF